MINFYRGNINYKYELLRNFEQKSAGNNCERMIWNDSLLLLNIRVW